MKAIQVLSFFIFCLSLSADEFPFPPGSKNGSLKERPFPKGEGKAFANAIDAPTSTVLSGAQIGFSAGTGAPSNGLTVSGQSLFRTSSNFTGGSLEIGGADRISFAIGGTKTSTDGSSQAGMFLNPTFTPASSTSIVANVLSYPQFSPAMGVTITNGANLYLQGGGQGGAGTVTNGYNLYVENAGFGTNRYGAYIGGKVGIVTLTPLNNLDVSGAVAIGGYAGANTAPSNGLIVSGEVGMTISSPLNELDVNGGVAIGSYAGTNTAPSGGLIVSGQTVLGNSTAFINVELSILGSYALQLQGGLVLNWSGHSASGAGQSYTIGVNDYYVAFDGGGFAYTFNLPATVPSNGWTCVIKDESGTAATNHITVQGNGQNINGASSYVINTNYGVVRIYALGGTQYYTW